ncbi:MAG: hypothetical protein ABW168_03455 [Sedimenticola sp.]
MPGLHADQLLLLNDLSSTTSPTEWSVRALRIAHPSLSEDEIMVMPMGTRDTLLMDIRSATFGPRLTAQQKCNACTEVFEISITAEEVGLVQGGESDTSYHQTVDTDRGRIDIRAVMVGDLIAVEHIADEKKAAQTLARRICSSEMVQIDERDMEVVTKATENLDPRADIWITANCPECGTDQHFMFDVTGYFQTEIERSAHRLMHEVAEIASVYHWSERDILAMAPARRRFYLQEATPQ